MSRSVGAAVLGILALAVVMAGSAQAGPTSPQKCTASKLKITGKKASCILGVDSKVAGKGGSADTTKCRTTYLNAMTKLAAKADCTNSADAATVELQVDAFTSDVQAELAIATPNRCQAGKIKAVGKKQACEFSADGKAVLKGGTADFSKCAATFTSSFAKLELKGGCRTSSDTGTIEAKVDAFVSDVFNDVPICAHEGDFCGSCGIGVCVRHCPGSSLVCLDNATFGPSGCTTDATCASGEICGAVGANCGTGMTNGCASICP